MRIEEITEASLRKVSDKEIYNLRLRSIQIYDKNFKGNNKAQAGELKRETLLDKYRLIRHEMRRRNLRYLKETAIDRAIFKRAFVGIDVPSLGDVVVVNDYVSIGGSFVKSPSDAEDIDLIIRDSDSNRDEGLELKLGRIIKDRTKKEPHFVYSPKGAHSTFIPLADLVLRAKDETKKVEVKEGLEKSMKEYYEGLDNWDDDYRKDNEEVIKNLAPGSVLDLGCGTCRLLKMLKSSDREVMGLDINGIALDYCKKRNVDTKKIDLEKDSIPFEDKAFDNVIMVHSFEHLDNPEAIIKEACRVANKRMIILSPLGGRQDPSHKQKFMTVNDFKQYFGRQWEVKEIRETNSAIAVRKFEDVEKVALRPFGSYVPPKPTMSGLTEAFSVEQIWKWAEKRLPLDIEEKLNGFRCIAEKAGDRLRIKTEGDKERTAQFSDLADVLKKIPDDFILDCSVGIDRNGKPLPRIKLMTLMADKPELEEKDVIKATAFDIPYWKGDLHEQPLSERRKKLESFYNKYLKGSPHFAITHYNVVNNRKELETKFREMSKLPQSEGILIKTLDGIWDTDGSCETWAKLKHEAEIKVIVLERHDVKGGNYNYTCGLLPGDSKYTNLIEFRGKKYINLGKCFNTKLRAEPGEILTMGVEEIIPSDDKLQWLGARVLDIDKDRKLPYFANQVIGIAERANVLQKAEEGNIDYKVGDKGKGVLQLHIMGIEEERIEALEKVSQEAVRSRANPLKLKLLLKGAIGEQGAHLDVRLVRTGDDYFEGGEIMIGNLTGLDKLKKLEQKAKLRFGWKVPRKEEPTAETIRGPVSWMKAGLKKIEIFPPGEVGATANKYGAMLILDSFDFEMYLADEHAKKFHFSGGKLIDGNYLMAYVPVADGRVWMISKLRDDDHLKEQKGLQKFKVLKVNKREYIVGGIVSVANEVDTQGDILPAKEIWKGMKSWMLKGGKVKVMHKGIPINAKVIECFQADTKTYKGGRTEDHAINPGDWYASVYLGASKKSREVFDRIVKGELNSFSIGGTAERKNI